MASMGGAGGGHSACSSSSSSLVYRNGCGVGGVCGVYSVDVAIACSKVGKFVYVFGKFVGG